MFTNFFFAISLRGRICTLYLAQVIKRDIAHFLSVDSSSEHI